jgi:epoxyqueuosine reductase
VDHQWTPALEQWLREQAIDAGFDTAGIASVDFAPGDIDAQRFADWIAQGRAGEMDYLKRRDGSGTLLRSAVQVAIPWARSVVVCALNYNAAAPLSTDPAPPNAGWIARYAWSGHANPTNPADLAPTDYHNQLLTRLRIIEMAIQQRFASEPLSEDIETRCYVDTGPLVERTAAARAGVGWIGKNTCVINQQVGSWLLLGVVITSIPIADGEVFSIAPDRCGSCTRCIDACPTDALVAPHQMDASRCIAYLTIEKKGSIPANLRAPIGRQVFGCDICQDVCPWNRKSHPKQSSAQDSLTHKDDMIPRPQLINPALDWLASMDSAEFSRWFKGSPIERTRRKRMQRNVAIAMGNTGDPHFLPQLEAWATARATAEDPILAEAATWAIEQINEPR